MEKLKRLGINPETLAAYNRPLRSFVWVVLVVLSCSGVVNIGTELQLLIFADLGIYGISRSAEKINIKNRGA